MWGFIQHNSLFDDSSRFLYFNTICAFTTSSSLCTWPSPKFKVIHIAAATAAILYPWQQWIWVLIILVIFFFHCGHHFYLSDNEFCRAVVFATMYLLFFVLMVWYCINTEPVCTIFCVKQYFDNFMWLQMVEKNNMWI